MMRPVVFKVQNFKDSSERTLARSRKNLLWALEALTRIDQEYLDDYPNTPYLYDSHPVGVLGYIPEVNTEEWLDIPQIIEEGGGDCEDLACWRAAELRLQGVPAKPYIKWRKVKGNYRFHAVVELPGGEIEDPSRKLGMRHYAAYLGGNRTPKEAARGFLKDAETAKRKGFERAAATLKLRARQSLEGGDDCIYQDCSDRDGEGRDGEGRDGGVDIMGPVNYMVPNHSAMGRGNGATHVRSGGRHDLVGTRRGNHRSGRVQVVHYR